MQSTINLKYQGNETWGSQSSKERKAVYIPTEILRDYLMGVTKVNVLES